MFTPRSVRKSCDPTAVTSQNHEQHLESPSDRLFCIHPQPTAAQAEGDPGTPILFPEKVTRDEVTFKIHFGIRKRARSNPPFTPSIKAPKTDTVRKPATEPLHSIGTPAGLASPSLDQVYRPNNEIPKGHDDAFETNSIPESSRVGYPKGRTDILPPEPNLGRENLWESPGPTANKDQKHPDKDQNALHARKSAPPPKFSVTIDSPPGRALGSGDINVTDRDQESRPRLAPESIYSHSPETLHDNDELDDCWELEHGFGLKTISKTVEDALEKLRHLKTQETPSEDESDLGDGSTSGEGTASRKQQEEVKIGVVRALLKWVPSIHLVALGSEHTGSPENAQKCLVYAAKALGALNRLEKNYGLDDLEYGVSVQLRSLKNKVIKEWRNVTGYQPYGILVWVWRDLCLSILSSEDLGQDSGVELVSQLFSDIKSYVPSENYDFREKKYTVSFWDLFLTGGLLANRKGTPRKLADPAYWSGSFVKAKVRLDQLYRADRLNELQMYPSVDLYRTVKSIFPEKYKTEPLEAVRNGCGPSTVDGQIDIFIFENVTTAFERLIENDLLGRNSKRYRDILVSFSSMDKEEAEWARKQALIGFEEEVNALLRELLRVFPNVHVAFSTFTKGKGVEGGTRKWFLEKAREGCTENIDSAIPTIRVDGKSEISDGAKKSSAVDYSYIFAAYLAMGTSWGGSRGSKGPSRERLLGEMKTVFLSKVGILLELDRWVGKTLKKGCKKFRAHGLGEGLDYLLGDFGFEKILGVGVQAKKRGRPKLIPSKKVSRGMALAKAKGARRPMNKTVAFDED